jgi:microtubule-associated protein-like 1/2
MLENEKDNLNDRIANLEKRVQQQDDEIICLKSTISEVLKRLQIIEAQKGISSSSSTAPQKPVVSNTRPATVAVTPTKRHEKPVNTTSRSIKVDSSTAPSSAPTPATTNSKTTAVVKKNIPLAKDKNTSFQYNDENKSVKMFLRGRPINFHLPSNDEHYNIDSMTKAPKEQLKLEWVYGYRGKDCRSNLYQLATGEIVYFIASTVVLFNIEENSQRHYLSHTDDIKCLAIHPDGVTIATGQVAGHDAIEGKPHIRIWNSVNLNTLQIIGFNSLDYFQNAICCLSFSKADGGENLCVVDDGAEKNLSVWNWQSNTKLASAKCYGDLIFASEFHPTEKNVIVSCGKQAIFFWNFDGAHLIKKSGTFDKIEKPKYILCIGFLPTGDCVSGDSEGNILIWNHKEAKVNKQIKEAHEGGVFSIFVLPSSNSSSVLMVTGGGKDGKLVEWNNEYKKSGRVIQIPDVNGQCRFISQANGNMFLVGTTKNCILRGNFDLNLTCVMNGHIDEVWGLACNPREASFVTCGNDRLLLFWDILTHSLLWSLTIDESCGGAHCAHFHPNFYVLAVGHVKNKWSVYDLNERKSIFLQIEGTEQIECIQYSPNGQYLAVGSRDNSIYVYTVNEDGTKYSRIGRFTGHSSYITHIDWSVDSQHLMSNSGDYEILFWEVSSCKQLTHAHQIRNLEWSSNNCTLSPKSFGIWGAIDVEIDTRKPGLKLSTLDGTDVNSTCVSNSKRFLVSGDDFGCLNFHAFPCNTSKSEKRVLHGHSSHVTNVSFTNNDSRVISIGGNDMSIFEWLITNE